MMKKLSGLKKTLAAILVPAMVLSGGSFTVFAEAPRARDSLFMKNLAEGYREPEQQFKSETRWWLPEGAHTDETIIEEITTLHDQGFTGFELCMLNESNINTNIYAYGSEEWAHDVKLAIETASELGMSVSLTSGTNWSTANIPGLDPNDEAASQEVGYSVEKIAAGESKSGKLKAPSVRKGVDASVVKQTLIGVYAYEIAEESTAEKGPSYSAPTIIDKASCINLTDQVQGKDEDKSWTLEWSPKQEGDYLIYSLWQQGSYQTNNPAQETAYTINYFDAAGMEGIKDYLESYLFADEELVALMKNCDIQFFMDSLEFSSSQGDSLMWAHDMAEEFEKRKGYDIRPYLPLFIGTSNRWNLDYDDAMGSYQFADSELNRKIRNDLYDVYTQVYQEDTMVPLRQWANEKYGIKLRAQISYGTWMEISEPAMSVDYPETETLNQKDQVDIFRLWGGSTHILDQILSSETGAIGGMNYALTEQDLLRMSYIQFAAGVSRIIWHGHSSSWGPEASIEWPGFEGMMSFIAGRLDTREPNAKDYAEMNDHMGRVQKLLRTGTSRTDLGILYLKYGEGMPTGKSYYDPMSEHAGIKWQDLTLQDAGYTYDYFSPAFLSKMTYNEQTGTLGDTVGYQAILLNQAELPVEAAKTLLGFAKQGLKVVIVDGAATATPYNDGKEAELTQVVNELRKQEHVIGVSTEAEAYGALQSMGVTPRAELVGSNTQLLTQLRQEGNDLYLYAYNYCDDEHCGLNHGLNAATEVSMDGMYVPYYIDSWTGKVEKVANYRYEDGRTVFKVSLDYNDVALYAFEAVSREELHVVSTNADKVSCENGTAKIRASQSGTYTAALSDGAAYSCDLSVPEARELTGWDIAVESWTKGEKIYREETRNTTVYNPETGKQEPQEVTTREAKFETNKEKIQVTRKHLVTWDKIPEVGKDVSGIGYYKTNFNWDAQAATGACLDLGEFPQSAVVTVNGKKADVVNVNNAVVDISGLLVDGENVVEIVVTSTLTNRLIAMGWGGRRPLSPGSAGYNDYEVKVFKNGLSKVTLMPYVEVVLDEENKEIPADTQLENAQKEIAAAQEKADKAAAEAAAAKKRAEQLYQDAQKAIANAQADAEEKKAAAEAARKKADEAQKKADEALKAAEKAQKQVQAMQQKADFQAKKVTLKSLKSTRKKQATVQWKKVSGASGYQVQYSWKSNMKSAKKFTVKGNKVFRKSFKNGLKSKKKVYVRVRAYKTIDGSKVYTSYSAKKSVKVK